MGRIHASHVLTDSNGLVWCRRCGAHARKVLRTLRDPCKCKPRSATCGSVLGRLRQGLQPQGVACQPVRPMPARKGKLGGARPKVMAESAGGQAERAGTRHTRRIVLRRDEADGGNAQVQAHAGSSQVADGLQLVRALAGDSSNGAVEANVRERSGERCIARLGQMRRRGCSTCACGSATRLGCTVCGATVCLECARQRR